MSAKNAIRFLIIPAAVLIAFIAIFYSADNETNSVNTEYINSCGWQVEERCADISYITIPEEFDAVFSAYNDIIKEGGFNLTPYKGMRAVRYTYIVTNHPDSDSRLIRINIIVCKDKIISADISSLGQNSFIEPLIQSE